MDIFAAVQDSFTGEIVLFKIFSSESAVLRS